MKLKLKKLDTEPTPAPRKETRLEVLRAFAKSVGEVHLSTGLRCSAIQNTTLFRAHYDGVEVLVNEDLSLSLYWAEDEDSPEPVEDFEKPLDAAFAFVTLWLERERFPWIRERLMPKSKKPKLTTKKKG